MLKNQELPPLSDRLHKRMGQKLLLWWINHRKSILPKDRRIGLAITELCSQKQVFIENAQSRYSNRTVTKQTPQLESNHPVDSSARVKSARFKSPGRQFSYIQITQ